VEEKPPLNSEPEESNEVIEDVQVCPSCSTPLSSGSKFCGECGHKITEAKAPVEETEPEPVEETEPETVEESEEPATETASDEEFDYSQVNPATDWECYGSIEPDHSECKKCPYREPCAKESGVEL
jgi:uncharacterized Zn finger protein (UPF0148 family)